MKEEPNPATGGVYWVVSPEYAALMQSKMNKVSLSMDVPNDKPERNYNRGGGIFYPPELKHGSTARKIFIHIRRVSDGEVRTITENGRDSWAFAWAEGNQSCDCNRRRYFEGDDFDDDADNECTETDYIVRIFDANTGEMLYDEWEVNK